MKTVTEIIELAGPYDVSKRAYVLKIRKQIDSSLSEKIKGIWYIEDWVGDYIAGALTWDLTPGLVIKSINEEMKIPEPIKEIIDSTHLTVEDIHEFHEHFRGKAFSVLYADPHPIPKEKVEFKNSISWTIWVIGMTIALSIGLVIWYYRDYFMAVGM